MREGAPSTEHRSRAICDLQSVMRGEQASDEDDERRATATMNEYWGFFGLVLVCSILFFIFYFLLTPFLLEFVLLFLCIDCIGVWFSLLSLPAT